MGMFPSPQHGRRPGGPAAGPMETPGREGAGHPYPPYNAPGGSPPPGHRREGAAAGEQEGNVNISELLMYNDGEGEGGERQDSNSEGKS